MTTDATPETQQTFGRFKVVPVAEIKTGKAVGLYGPPGAGKTTLAGTLATYEEFCPVCIIDAEGGSKVLNDYKNIDIIPVANWKDVEDLRTEFIRVGGSAGIPWKTIIVDNLSEFMTMCVFDKFGTVQLTQPNWGEVQRAMINQIRFYRDLARDKGINVVLIAWDVEDKDASGRIKRQMNFIPSLQNTIPGLLDYVGHITVLPNGKRQITFATDPQKNVAKFRRNASSIEQQIPLVIEYDLAHQPLVDIFRTLGEGVEWPKSKYEPAKAAAQTTPANA